MNNREANFSELAILLTQAKHILEVLYPQLKDHKLLRQYLKILSQATKLFMSCATPQEQQDPRFEKLKAIKETLGEIEEDLKSGPKDFMRTETYIICAKDYKVHQLSFTTLEEFLHTAQQTYTWMNTSHT